jgi:4'-phosphopantetheinyl transferase
LLRRFLGVKEDGDLTEGPDGRPELKEGTPRFSISHSGSLCALAVSDALVGLDLEFLGRDVSGDSIARKVLTSEEYAVYSQRLNDPEYFFSIWTRKESVMKATGKGFSLNPASFCVIPLGREDHFVLDRKWYFQTFEVARHIFSLCGAEGPLDVSLVEAKTEDLLDGGEKEGAAAAPAGGASGRARSASPDGGAKKP